MSRARSLLVLSLCLAATSARANGRFPSAQLVALAPGDDPGIIALGTTFGVMLSRDAGSSFRWMCEAQLFRPLSPTGELDPGLAVDGQGALFVGFPGGLHRSPDGCVVEPDPAARDHLFVDLTRSPDGSAVYALEFVPPQSARVWRRERAGFVPLGPAFGELTPTNLDVAPSDPRHLVVTGFGRVARAPRVYRTDDSGGRWTQARSEGLSGLQGAWLSAIDRREPTTLWARFDRGNGTVLARSTDDGDRWSVALETRGPMLGFALGDDGTVWAGGPDDGLYRADPGGSFARVDGAPGPRCLRAQGPLLLACGDLVREGWSLARSRDRGAHFEPILRFADVSGPFVCPAELVGPMVCGWQWPQQRAQFGRPPPDASAPVTDASLDAAADGPVAMAPPTGCSCRTFSPSRTENVPLGAWVTAIVSASLSRRWPRRRPRVPSRPRHGWTQSDASS